MGKTYIVGASEQGQIVAEILNLNGVQVAGFFDDADIDTYLGLSVLGGTSDIEKFLGSKDSFIVAIGNCRVRERIYERYRGKLKFASAIHPSAVIMPSAKIGEGVTIHPGVIIETGAEIGEGVILNTGCIIDHHNKIGNYSQICPGVVLGGKVTIGNATWIGLNATVRDHISVGDYCFIGQGSNVVKSLPDGVLAYGNPAKQRGEIPYISKANEQ